MFSIPLCLRIPPGPPGQWPTFHWPAILAGHSHFMEVAKEFGHCAYFGLLFLEGAQKWYVWAALPLLVITILSIISSRG